MAGKAIYAALMAVQSELKAPKGQKNTFGNYSYRSAEDILEAVKPLLKEKRGCRKEGDGRSAGDGSNVLLRP